MEYRDRYLDLIWTEGAFLVREEPFTLKSGRRSYVYANHRNLICVPEFLAVLGDSLSAAAKAKYGPDVALAGVDSSASAFLLTATSLRSGIPLLNYRPVNREKGVNETVFSYLGTTTGAGDAPRPVVLVDDVVTSATTLEAAAIDIEDANWEVLGAVCLLDRRRARDRESASLHVESVATLDMVIHHGISGGFVAPIVQRQAEIELGDLS